MEEVNRRRRTVLQVQVGELHLWRLSQSSSPRKCRFHIGFSLVLLTTVNLSGLVVFVARSLSFGCCCYASQKVR